MVDALVYRSAIVHVDERVTAFESGHMGGGLVRNRESVGPRRRFGCLSGIRRDEQQQGEPQNRASSKPHISHDSTVWEDVLQIRNVVGIREQRASGDW